MLKGTEMEDKKINIDLALRLAEKTKENKDLERRHTRLVGELEAEITALNHQLISLRNKVANYKTILNEQLFRHHSSAVIIPSEQNDRNETTEAFAAVVFFITAAVIALIVLAAATGAI